MIQQKKVTLCMIGYFDALRENGKIFIDSKFGQLVNQLAPHFEKIYYLASNINTNFHGPTNDNHGLSYIVTSPNVYVIQIEPSSDRTPPLRKLIVWLKRIAPYYSYIKDSDFIYITLPGFSGFLAHLLCRYLYKPYCLYFGSDWQEVAPFMAKWQGWNGYLLSLYIRLSHWAENIAVRGSRFALVHGQKLKDKFKDHGVPIFETVPMVSITPQMFFYREDTCQKKVIRCLFVGALIARKGILDLIDAIPILNSRGRNTELYLVGTGDEEYMRLIADKIKYLHLEQFIKTLGHISNIENLISVYRDADIFVLPTHGEGFPRVIYEAMSQGLPVVVTSIGTIASVLSHEETAIFVPPSQPIAIADAVERLTKDAELRRKLISKSYQFVVSRIGEVKTSQQLIELIQNYGILGETVESQH